MTDDIIDWGEKHTKLPAGDRKPMQLTPLQRELLRRMTDHNHVIVRQGAKLGYTVLGNYRPTPPSAEVPEGGSNAVRFWLLGTP